MNTTEKKKKHSTVTDGDKSHGENQGKRSRGKPWRGVCDFQLDGQVGFM